MIDFSYGSFHDSILNNLSSINNKCIIVSIIVIFWKLYQYALICGKIMSELSCCS